MRIFRSLVGNDENATNVIKEFRRSSLPRLAVKRPNDALELVPGVVHAFEGKTVRYDVYVRSL
jgi:16S rRNA (guanine1516-N2)-methyltransferase